MKIKIPHMIFFGVIKFLFYIVLPLFIINIVQAYGIMQFSDVYVLGIIIIGVIGTIITVLTHTFKKDTVAHSYTRIIDSLYSAIFTFYIFGGFTVGDGFGNFTISTDVAGFDISARIGIQVIAYILMIGAAFAVVQHIFKTAELKKDKEYNITIKRKFRASKAFRIAGIVANLILLAYIVSIPLSAIHIRPSLIGGAPTFGYHDGGTPVDPLDDSLNMYLGFSIANGGAWSIFDVRLDVDLIVKDCYNGTGIPIPDNTRIGGSPDVDYNFLQFSTTSDNLTVSILSEFLIDLLISNATLIFDISFEGRYAQITADVTLAFEMPWENQTHF